VYIQLNSAGINLQSREFDRGLKFNGRLWDEFLMRSETIYPKPGPSGGVLIREVIQFLRSQKQALPVSSHILIAVSGGADSLALAHLLIKYGRRVVAKEQIRLIHINHGWRGEQSDEDARFVRKFGRTWDIPVHIVKAKPPGIEAQGESWEDLARETRKAVFRKYAAKYKAQVLTAHQAEDFAETMLWRILTGSFQTHGGGILVQTESEVRPFLRTRKRLLLEYLREEGMEWREDSSNFAGRFLRSKMRLYMMPIVEELFPKAVDHLVRLGLEVQENRENSQITKNSEKEGPLMALLAGPGIRLRRAHWDAIKKRSQTGLWQGDLHLPDGWKLTRRVSRSKRVAEQWVLEKS